MASLLKVDKLDPQSGTALELGTSGDTISVPSGATLDISASTLTPPATMPASSGVNLTALNATQLTSGTVPDARFPATLPAASGVNLTSLTATNLGSGTVPTASLGTGTASSSTVLYGDQTYKAEPGGGKILQVVTATYVTATYSTSGTFADFFTSAITPTAAGSKILVLGRSCAGASGGGDDISYHLKMMRDINSAGYNLISSAPNSIGYQLISSSSHGTQVTDQCTNILDSPSYTLTDVITYKYMIACVHGGTATYNDGGTESVITLLEVAA